MMNKINLLLVCSLIISSYASGQEILNKADAVSIALENNFSIRSIKNVEEIAKNNSSRKNAGYLPTVSASGSANYSISDSENTLLDGSVQEAKAASTLSYNANVNLNYVVFDGFGRAYNYKQLQEDYALSQLEARNVIENSIINLFNSYYEVARLSQNEAVLRESMSVSGDRKSRAEYSYEYGKSTQLDVLNAEVDYNNDSINYLTIVQLLNNEKRNLNLLLARDIDTDFIVDTNVIYTNELDLSSVMNDALANNAGILQAQSALRNAEYGIKLSASPALPRIALNASYGYNYTDFANGFFDSQWQLGPSFSASLSWNIFDGGATNVRKQNSKILVENQGVGLEQMNMDLQRRVSNAWTNFQTALFVMEAGAKNLETNKRNFQRSEDQYNLGQINSLLFRQAQLNLLNAHLNYNNSKYKAKLAELALLQLSGGLLDKVN